MNRSILLSTILLVFVLSACGPSQADVQATADAGAAQTQAAIPTSTPVPTSTTVPTATARPTAKPRPTATTDPCISWEKVTADMKGQKACVRGVITELKQSRQVGTRYQFSKQSGTFFLYSAYWEIYNPATGKTIGPGTCVEIIGPVEVQSGVPFINIDKLAGSTPGEEIGGFRFYNDPAACG